MGALFGAGFAVILLVGNYSGLAKVIATSESPMLIRIVLVAGIAGSFAFCAAITGFLFLVHEDSEARPTLPVIARSAATKQSSAVHGPGLLRFARNDG